MNDERARAYNAAAEPELRRRGIRIIDTFSSSSRHPDLSPDGVHFPGTISRHYTQLFLNELCGAVAASAGSAAAAAIQNKAHPLEGRALRRSASTAPRGSVGMRGDAHLGHVLTAV